MKKKAGITFTLIVLFFQSCYTPFCVLFRLPCIDIYTSKKPNPAQEKLEKTEMELISFVSINIDIIEKESAIGGGEHLKMMLAISECPEKSTIEIFQIIQNNYSQLMLSNYTPTVSSKDYLLRARGLHYLSELQSIIKPKGNNICPYMLEMKFSI